MRNSHLDTRVLTMCDDEEEEAKGGITKEEHMYLVVAMARAWTGPELSVLSFKASSTILRNWNRRETKKIFFLNYL